jgi:hypothetical protein
MNKKMSKNLEELFYSIPSACETYETTDTSDKSEEEYECLKNEIKCIVRSIECNKINGKFAFIYSLSNEVTEVMERKIFELLYDRGYSVFTHPYDVIPGAIVISWANKR